MNKRFSKQLLAALALLGSSVSYGATVTFSVTENSGLANDGLVNVGDSFSILMSGSDFPQTAGASLLATFNNAVGAINTPVGTSGILVAPGSPFAPGVLVNNPAPSPVFFSFLAPTTGDLPSGNFPVVVFNFTATGEGLLDLVVGEDGGQADGWPDVDFSPIDVTYNMSGAFVQVIPVPAAAWLFVSAVGGLAALRRRQAK